MNTYTQLSQQERYQIYALKQAGHSYSDIAVILKRHKSRISREVNRNRCMRGYHPMRSGQVWLMNGVG